MRVFLAWAFLLLALGCDSGSSSYVPVTGKVTFKGAALHSGTIVFSPDVQRGCGGLPARAEIQPDGSFTLSTGDQPGSSPGWHRVTIVALEPPAALPAGEAFAIPHSLLPEKYRDPELSGLACEVRSGDDNHIDFNLD
jgi:hypothetical protein